MQELNQILVQYIFKAFADWKLYQEALRKGQNLIQTRKILLAN